ncbi:FkbM family methyltransferase [Clostridium beijerinckii]|uniref:FkbM family methyltransferase n=1 Tax=Clostridium beijerinckii TaxID=1520 RepID=UPI000ADECABF|nr:FkbM family methyltransferase [Clostridium beijerinckii]
MNYIKRINEAIDYAIESNYSIYNRETEILERLKNAQNVCIFGVGAFFEGYSDGFASIFSQFNIKCVSDNNHNKWGKKIKEFVCVSPKQLQEMKDVVVIVMAGVYKDICNQLTNMGIENYFIGDIVLNVYGKFHNCEWFLKEKENILNAFELFEDEKSKEIFTEALCNRIAPHLAEKIFNQFETKDEYFEHGIFEFSDNEYMVDAGAFDGDSMSDFIKKVNGCFGGVYSFELDVNNFEKLKKNTEKYNTEKIEIYNAGVFEKNMEISYESNGPLASIGNGLSQKAKVIKLDDMLANKKVTFIKMDIEGSEQAALRGAEQIIISQKPKLAISSYHRLEDLWQIPLHIKSLNNDYKIYLRHHSPIVWDTDCYAY